MRRLAQAVVAAAVMGTAVPAQTPQTFIPARFRSGPLPPLSPLALGGGQVFVEVSVDNQGKVTAVTPLRATPPFTDLVVPAVKRWQFTPAEADERQADGSVKRQKVASKVLVASLFRPPTFNSPTQGTTPRDVASESDETPFPMTTSVPPMTPLAYTSGVVMLEVEVGLTGGVGSATVLRSAPPFDDAALAATRQWSFRPARVRGRSVATRAYLIYGFTIPMNCVPEPKPGEPPLPKGFFICPTTTTTTVPGGG